MKEIAIAFLHAALADSNRLCVAVTCVMTDNWSCYRGAAFRNACKALNLKHIRTRPYTPKTNGKAARFIQTSLREWAYAQASQIQDPRTEERQPCLQDYNWHRPPGSIQR